MICTTQIVTPLIGVQIYLLTLTNVLRSDPLIPVHHDQHPPPPAQDAMTPAGQLNPMEKYPFNFPGAADCIVRKILGI